MQYNHEEYEKKAQESLEKAKCYEIVLSTKDRIKCDGDELWKVIEGIQSGSIVKLKQGILNPSFYVSIVLDEKRYADYKDKVYGVLQNNRQAIEYHGGKGLQRLPEIKRLADIFSGTNLKQLPTNGQKRLP